MKTLDLTEKGLVDKAEAIARHVARRLENPRGRVENGKYYATPAQPRDLSPFDREEINGVVFETLTFSGFFKTGNITFTDWKNCFRQARKVLRIDRTQESALTDAMAETIAYMPYSPSVLTDEQRRHLKYVFACIREGVKKSRKHKALFRSCRSFLLSCLGLDKGNVPLNPSAFRNRKALLLETIKRGERALSAQAMEGINNTVSMSERLERALMTAQSA